MKKHFIKFYKYYLIITILLVILGYNLLFENNKYNSQEISLQSATDAIEPLCADKLLGITEFEEIGKLNIKIEINDSRKWYQNIIKAKIESKKSNYNLIDTKYKKKFKAKVFVSNGLSKECVYLAKININGDLADHIRQDINNPVSSISVDLQNGNLLGIVKFKLLLPETRNSSYEARENEIVLATLFRELNILSPRTAKKTVEVNSTKVEYIFQEDIEKELLEYNSRREAPIIELNEEFYWKNLGKEPIYDGYNSLTAKIKNNKWLAESSNRQLIVKKGLDLINNALVYDLPSPAIYNLEDALSQSSNNSEKLFIYRSILVATNSYHALDSRNRNFYYDPISNIVEPIYYDGNPKIMGLLIPEHKNDSRPTIRNSEIALRAVEQLDVNLFHSHLKNYGVKISKKETAEIITQLKNLLTRMIDSKSLLEPVLPPEQKRFDKITDNDFSIAFFTLKQNEFQICSANTSDCYFEDLKLEEIDQLFAGNYVKNNKNIYYSGQTLQSYLSDEYIIKKDFVKETTVNESFTIKIFDNTNVEVDYERKKIQINLEFRNSKVLVEGTEIKDWIFSVDSPTETSAVSEDRFDEHLLTGCMTFFNLSVYNIEINTFNTACEDAINFISTNGSVKNVDINVTSFDGVDADFSNLIIDDLNIRDAGNDCLDLSQGSYNIANANLYKCSDKSLSIGEKSLVTLSNFVSVESLNGIAVKDWSQLIISNANINSKNYCLAAYRKKQEFGSAKIFYDKLNCSNSNIISQDYSIIRQR